MRSVLLCRPTYYRVDYTINPWMEVGSVNQSVALTQWENLEHIYKQLGVYVEIIEQNKDFPDMVFAADQGVLVNDRRILLSSFKYAQRRGESTVYKKWYENHGYEVVTVPPDVYFEGGGEMQRWKDMLLVGTGFRTNDQAIKYIGKVFNKEVIKLNLIHERFYHLDTCLFVLSNSTIFYYPPAFAPESQLFLAKAVPNLIPITTNEAENFAANSVVFDHTVIVQKNNPILENQIRSDGFDVIPINMSEFARAGGGIHCLTGDLGNR